MMQKGWKSMDCKNDIKTQRIKRYFLEATKQIILTEGVEGVSARKIAKIAGYSYATTYNYFKDINQLLGETKALMVTDVSKYIQETMCFPIISIEDIKMLFRAYLQYYLSHPHIFRFFYFYRLSDDEAQKERYDFSDSWTWTFRFLVEEGSMKETEVEYCAKSLIYSAHGLLALFFSGNGITEEMMFADLDKIIDYILRR